MTRQREYRAWHREKKVMLYETHIGDVFKWLHEGQPIDIMDFTGLRDSKRTEEHPNGRKIWEGDIVSVSVLAGGVEGANEGEFIVEPEESYLLAKIEFVNGAFVAMVLDKTDEGDDAIPYLLLDDADTEVDVIGNVYENPELLQE